MVATASIIARVASSPSLPRRWASVGTNACVNAPSPNSRRSRLGMRNATRNASYGAPAPNTEAMMTSRTSPVMREASVNREMVDAARSRFMTPDAILVVFARTQLASSFQDGHRRKNQEKNRPHRLGPQARPPGHQAQRRQHGHALALSHRHQERAEGRRCRRQDQGRRALQGRATRDRFGRRQGSLPQEQGGAPQEPPRREGEGAGHGLNVLRAQKRAR